MNVATDVMRACLALLIAAGTTLGTSSAALGAEESSPAKTVAAFYDWYLIHHGQVSKILPQARRFLDNNLYSGLEDSYFKGDEYMGEMLVSLCTHNAAPPSPNCKFVRYDPFANDSSAAASYAIGATRTEGNSATVKVILRFSLDGHAESHVSVILHSKAGHFIISNLLFEPRGYYYAGPIVDVMKFLGAYNC